MNRAFNKLCKYIVFYADFTRKEYKKEFVNDIRNNKGINTLNTINALIDNNNALNFPYLKDLLSIKKSVLKLVK